MGFGTLCKTLSVSLFATVCIVLMFLHNLLELFGIGTLFSNIFRDIIANSIILVINLITAGYQNKAFASNSVGEGLCLHL